VWVLFNEAKRAIRQEDLVASARLAALRKAAEGLLCSSPQGRREFDSALGLACIFPKKEVDSELGFLTPVPQPTPTITGWERGEVVHRARTGKNKAKTLRGWAAKRAKEKAEMKWGFGEYERS
jgi:hypothetical protein